MEVDNFYARLQDTGDSTELAQRWTERETTSGHNDVGPWPGPLQGPAWSQPGPISSAPSGQDSRLVACPGDTAAVQHALTKVGSFADEYRCNWDTEGGIYDDFSAMIAQTATPISYSTPTSQSSVRPSETPSTSPGNVARDEQAPPVPKSQNTHSDGGRSGTSGTRE
ncbi:hypothetical protein F503_02575 [Ophiostoma piceae UAMH 11346]|uniref:Uncharacterized protein n=1 Tax=Ophiostoma piceae (strain UAMH 11346) TaxID=1262450 RepID=S3C129_OPHP1|nr:hypothetical protein F503_02575 [Ophiostoma piceae UAMH 11346]